MQKRKGQTINKANLLMIVVFMKKIATNNQTAFIICPVMIPFVIVGCFFYQPVVKTGSRTNQ
jgi:hypothetical protein